MAENKLSDKEREDLKKKFEAQPKEIQDYMSFVIGSLVNAVEENEVSHSDEETEEEIIEHEDKKITKPEELTDDQLDILETLIKNMAENKLSDKEREDLKKKFEAQPKEIQDYMSFVIGSLVNAVEESSEKTKNNSKEKEGEKDMGNISQSVFDNTNNETLSHDDVKEIFANAKKCGSLKEAILEHAATYGIDGVENLFPDFKAVSDPITIKDNDGWVAKVMNNVKKVPFSKIKSTAFDITATEARAKGYVKGNRKVEEVITALKRETSSQTIYKLQKMDRDDVVDITDFDVVAYLKKELQDKLKEEIARAILIGDGRLPDAEDKIKENNIRPVASDDSTYSIKTVVSWATTAKNADIADEIIEKMLRTRKNYKGSGNLTFFCNSDYLTTMLLAKDTIGRKLYANESELASTLRVSDIVEVPVMDGATYTDPSTSKVYDIVGIAVDLGDYKIGNNDLGKTTMFDDFDIKYNQLYYLLETKMSGALYVPYSAIVLIKEQTTSAG